MTSKQIAKASQVKSNAQAYWLRELSFQFAVFNERNARMDAYHMELDARDAEREANKPKALAEFLEKASGTLDRIAPETRPISPFFSPGTN